MPPKTVVIHCFFVFFKSIHSPRERGRTRLLIRSRSESHCLRLVVTFALTARVVILHELAATKGTFFVLNYGEIRGFLRLVSIDLKEKTT